MPDPKYLNIFLEPILKSKAYRPKFGDSSKKEGFTLEEFYALYGADPFYAWIGLNTDLLYAAHRAAGGMTSLYRQIGIGCEDLFRQILIDVTGYTDPGLATWFYKTKTQSGRIKTLKLDGRLELAEISGTNVATNIRTWMQAYCEQIDAVVPTQGVVFEIRQGYKSKDSKRQNADYVKKYFHDMHCHFDALRQTLSSGARLRYIVGNSTFYGIHVKTEQLFQSSLVALGYHNISYTVVRKRNSKKELFEYCLVATWC
jgi:hypothetical protein